jgi:hypothetical protein
MAANFNQAIQRNCKQGHVEAVAADVPNQEKFTAARVFACCRKPKTARCTTELLQSFY